MDPRYNPQPPQESWPPGQPQYQPVPIPVSENDNAYESTTWQRPVETGLPSPPPYQQPADPYRSSYDSQPSPSSDPTPSPWGSTNGGQSSPQPQHQPVAAPPARPAHSVLPDQHNKNFRGLNLSKGELVLAEVRRHPIGILQIYIVAGFVLLALLFGGGALVRYLNNSPPDGLVGGSAFPFPVQLITWLAFGLGLLTILIAVIAIHVYNGNRLFVTNESVIQRVQASLFQTKEQTISLGNIEDVSFEQSGVLPHLFGYGSVRLSTEGEETTYYFRYASNPKAQAALITEAQEVFNKVHPEYHNSH